MNIDEQLKEINELKERLKVLENEVLNSVQPKQEYKRWRAEVEEEFYYTLQEDGIVRASGETNSVSDTHLYSIGNYFKTKEEAEEYKENLITKQKLKDIALRLNKGVEFDWNNTHQTKYRLYLDFGEALDITPCATWKSLGQIYCLDEDFLKIAKQEIGEEALIKLIKSGV